MKAGSESQVLRVPVFIGLYTKDSRLVLGADYYKDPLYGTPLAFDVVTEEELKKLDADRSLIPKAFLDPDGARRPTQPAYNFGAAQAEVYLQVPSL